MNHNSLHDPQGGNYGSYTPSASMGFRYNWDIYVSSTINRKRKGACNVCRRALLILHVLGPVCGSCSIGLCGHENLSLICWALI